MILNTLATFNKSFSLQQNFIKKVGIIMPWNGGFFTDDNEDPSIDTINKNIYEQSNR